MDDFFKRRLCQDYYKPMVDDIFEKFKNYDDETVNVYRDGLRMHIAIQLPSLFDFGFLPHNVITFDFEPSFYNTVILNYGERYDGIVHFSKSPRTARFSFATHPESTRSTVMYLLDFILTEWKKGMPTEEIWDYVETQASMDRL